ncbi:unnamed protein product [Strongylus vulgaris]|uniref:Uncharacterized protein n=1 Tax=Strongylus vulgaris TaxID=40348 RepID=A0A3P7KBG4_STRVU|nr:unnamed protein product [Strongylus vulgaris]
MLSEAVAIVCAPSHNQVGTFVMTSYGMGVVESCTETGFHLHPEAEKYEEMRYPKKPSARPKSALSTRGDAGVAAKNRSAQRRSLSTNTDKGVVKKKAKKETKEAEEEENDEINTDNEDADLSEATFGSYEKVLIPEVKNEGDIEYCGGFGTSSKDVEPDVRRSRRNVARKDYSVKQESDDTLSSSPQSSGSENVSDAMKSEASIDNDTMEESDASYDSDESFEVIPQKRAKSTKKAKRVAGSSLPQASKLDKPRQAGDSTAEGIVVPPRPLSKGERKMMKFRKFASGLAHGRNFELTMEEGCKLMQGLRAQSTAVQAAISTSLAQKEAAKESDSSSEDEWEEMEPIDIDESDVQVTLEKGEEKDWWAIFLRQEVNKLIRANWENAHKVNLLCCIGHLQFLRKIVLEENLIPSLMLTIMPTGYQKLVGEPLTIEDVRKITKWYHSAFKPSGDSIKYEAGTCRFDATARLSEMVSQQVFENDSDRTVVRLEYSDKDVDVKRFRFSYFLLFS